MISNKRFTLVHQTCTLFYYDRKWTYYALRIYIMYCYDKLLRFCRMRVHRSGKILHNLSHIQSKKYVYLNLLIFLYWLWESLLKDFNKFLGYLLWFDLISDFHHHVKLKGYWLKKRINQDNSSTCLNCSTKIKVLLWIFHHILK